MFPEKSAVLRTNQCIGCLPYRTESGSPRIQSQGECQCQSRAVWEGELQCNQLVSKICEVTKLTDKREGEGGG